ncbi:hypothetical protein [Polaromonas sp.]|uniref:hypothetical protein n=1 Tax=Polaromonas sp. TaxID=1869339 RepID=UPI001D60DF72|nr:hypothetical protein [Polaromonas sp.]MBT9475066.1 hypothetical protein [Polaromonas sp.]
MNTHATRATYVTRAMRCLPIAALCLAGQAMAQAAPANGGGAQAPTERAKPAHGEVRPVPATPPHYPSAPQPPVPTRR